MIYEITITGRDGQPTNFQVEISAANGSAKPSCRVDGKEVEIDALFSDSQLISLLFEGKSYETRRDSLGGDETIVVNGSAFLADVQDPRSLRARRGRSISSAGPKKIKAPMPGKVIRILVVEGAEVEIGQGVIVIEAMKMQNELKSPKTGTVQKVLALEGATVNPGDTLAIIE